LGSKEDVKDVVDLIARDAKKWMMKTNRFGVWNSMK
jgi:hypothetical protein